MKELFSLIKATGKSDLLALKRLKETYLFQKKHFYVKNNAQQIADFEF